MKRKKERNEAKKEMAEKKRGKKGEQKQKKDGDEVPARAPRPTELMWSW